MRKQVSFESGTALKHTEEEIFQEGCISKTGRTFEVDIKFRAATLRELLDKITEYYNVKAFDIKLNACGEKGRMDISIQEDDNAIKPTLDEIRQWKEKQKKLYIATYTYRIHRVTMEAVALYIL